MIVNGTRAVRGNWTGAQCLADQANIAKLFPAKTLIFGTSGPAPTDATTPDVNDAARLVFNTGIRAMPSPIAAVVDSGHFFDANDDGLWDNQLFQTDQVHPSPAGYLAHIAIVPARNLAGIPAVTQPWSRWAITARTDTWLDANDPTCFGRFSIADDTTAVYWAGKNNFGAYDKAAGATRPVLTANVSGTRSALRFTAASSQELVASGTPRRVLNSATGFFLLALIVPGAAGASSRYFYYLSTESDAALNRLGGRIATSGAVAVTMRRSNGSTSTSITSTSIPSSSSPCLVAAYADVTGASRLLNLRINGAADATPVSVTDSAGAFSASDAAASMLGSSNTIAGSFFDGYIFDAECRAGVFTLDQIQRAEADLAWDNGLQSILDAAHPYKAARPT